MKINHEEMLAWVRKIEEYATETTTEDKLIIPDLRAKGAFASIVGNFRDNASNFIICAQAKWVLQNDLATARAHFSSVENISSDVMPAIQDMSAAMAGEIPWDGNKLEYFLINPLMIGLLLANARASFDRLCGEIAENPGAFVPASKKHIVGQFAAQLADVGHGICDRIQLSDFARTQMFKPNHFLYGYHEMLFHIARADALEFERVRAERELAFPQRARSRVAPDQLDAWGHGKVAQMATFDAVGVALCRLAVWRNIPVDVDSKLYPREFYAD